MSELLKITGLRLEAYIDEQWKEIVHGVDLTLKPGEVLGLIGESGAGKSTIGLATMGYSRPGVRIAGGSILFDGIEITAASQEQLRQLRGSRIAYVAQSAAASFNPAHKIIQQYAEGPVQHGMKSFIEAQKNARQIYRALDLPDPDNIGDRYPHQISGGQLQRAMVAMALSCKPDLIVFDEPTTALDVTTQIEVLTAIRKVIKELNTAAIYITHDLAVVSQLADRIMVLRHGKLVEEGDTRQMLNDPQQQYTRELLSVRTYRKDEHESSDTVGPPVLEVSGVTAAYGNKNNVLKDVSLRIERKKTVAVVGESGSGKSTLTRVITGMLPPKEGSISFDGKLLAPIYKQRDREQLRRIQMIYQMPDVALNPMQSVGEILGRPLSFYFGIKGPELTKRVTELLEMIELPASYIDRYATDLSGGQKQRLCIARALAAAPDLIICDEVTSALDQLVAEEILKLLQRLQHELDISYLFITHDLTTVKAIADEIVVMYQGEVVEQGVRDTILTPPHHEYTELLLSSVPEMDPDWLDRVLKARNSVV